MEINDLGIRIENGIFNFKDSDIYLREFELQYLNFDSIKNLFFENCTFYGDFILSNKINKTSTLVFKHCSFLNGIQITQCEFNALSFFRILKAEEVSITGTYERISFTSYTDGTIIPRISISSEVHNLNFSDFKLKGDLFLSYGYTYESNNSYFSFNNSEFDNFNAHLINFGNLSNFENCKIKKKFSVFNCTFNDTSFSNLIFPVDSDFTNTTFNKYANFKNCSSQSEQTKLIIQNCTFKELVEFDNSIINLLDIKTTTFEQTSSFQNLRVKFIRISKSTFSKPAFFDDIKIDNISNLKTKHSLFSQSDWKITFRTIKHELQKAENRIDFNRFKNYEMAAYYEELNWRKDFTDKFILAATKITTDFGNSWRRALVFTLSSGLLFYVIFFLFEYYFTGNYQYYFNTNYGRIFWNGFMRFLLVTDFYNPLIEDRTYIQNFGSWIPFIIGKIVIAFGIYEMIQSFRKFKA